MAQRGNRRNAANAIRGPQSALTDFLASHNISAHQINLDYQQRLQHAQQQNEQERADEEDKENQSDEDGEDPVERKKRKRKEEKAIAAIKASKEFKRRKHERRLAVGSEADSEDDDILARDMINKTKPKIPKPGQFANCELCSKRFTVTPYTLAGQDGGFLCTKCGKGFKDDMKKTEAAKKKQQQQRAPKRAKRQLESDRMMGDVKPGAKSLVEQCVRRVADVVNDIEEFGDLPQNLLDRLSQILSQKRVLTSRTLQLFLQPGIDRIAVYDCGRLETEDFHKIFAFMPDVEMINLRFAGQLKDEQLLYMIEKNPKLRHLQLGATNLISDKVWVQLFQTRGPQLETLKLSELNDSLNDQSVNEMVKQCLNLKRLKLRSCSHMTETSLTAIATLPRLEHLSLAIAQNSSSDVLVTLINNLGPKLQTLSLEDFTEIDDNVLLAIASSCTKLAKLRLTGSSLCSDEGFARLFGPSSRNPPLPIIDLSSNRDVEIGDQEDEAEQLGFASQAFKALFRHSGQKIEKLDLHSCRHISHTALLEVFDGFKQYPTLTEMDLSFVTHVDATVMAGIFRSCPALQKLAVFACFAARDTRIPAGIAVVGLPNAQSQVVVEGDAMEF